MNLVAKVTKKREELIEKWTAHINANRHRIERYRDLESIALSALHWQHNVEFSMRDGRGAEWVENNRFFAREYARMATEFWLLTLIDKTAKDTYDRMDLGNLCCALEAFEANDKALNA